MNISTSCNTFEWAINISLELPLLWDSGRVEIKENLQKLVFPKGISYYHKIGTFLTDEVNEVFQPIPDQVKFLGD
ncbi:hypothetical protein GGD38_004305 [Chitinophagaceae bacterium OAS944]|nr:hypothetical protein [Chitinophagaceae bacterium OAS944]